MISEHVVFVIETVLMGATTVAALVGIQLAYDGGRRAGFSEGFEACRGAVLRYLDNVALEEISVVRPPR